MKQPGGKHVPSLVSLKKIFEGTSEHTGREFFRSLVKNLAEVLDVHGVWVTEYREKEHRLNALAFWLDGKFVEKYEYDVKGTPCEPVLGAGDICHIPDNVIDLYPDDPDLSPMGAVSYMGIPLKDTEGKVLGHLALLDSKPMEEIPEVFVIFRLFASRAMGELRRIKYEKKLEENEAKTNRLLNGTMDAIIEMNGDLKITQANVAACSDFRIREDQFIGKPLKDYLKPDSYQKILNTILSLKTGNDRPDSTWIQGFLECISSSGEAFPADATMSCYQNEENLFFALYIRDVQDRVKKEEMIRDLTLETSLLQEKVNDHQMNEMIGESPAIKQTLFQIEQVAPTESTVLILGETGTGKELVAGEIHRKSKRNGKPFIALNCAALPAELIESELFGHVKGAFTGATGTRDGRFLLADQGTLFLDEIGELPLNLQAKLLRVIQEGEFEPVGSSITNKVNVRIIAATHKDLHKEVSEKRFRADLFYRLNVFPITVPPLRARGNDIILLSEVFLNKFALRHGRKMEPLNEVVRQQLLKYSWPGNVRELQNIIERCVITSQEGKINLSNFLTSEGGTESESTAGGYPETHDKILTGTDLHELEKNNLQLALKRSGGKIFGKNGAAELVGIPPTTFCSKLKKYGISTKNIS